MKTIKKMNKMSKNLRLFLATVILIVVCSSLNGFAIQYLLEITWQKAFGNSFIIWTVIFGFIWCVGLISKLID